MHAALLLCHRSYLVVIFGYKRVIVWNLHITFINSYFLKICNSSFCDFVDMQYDNKYVWIVALEEKYSFICTYY